MYDAKLAGFQDVIDKLLGMQPVVEKLRLINESLVTENEQLSEQLAVLLKRLYGKSYEKIDPDQLILFTGHIDERPLAQRMKKVKGHGRQSFPEHLQRADWVCDLAEDDKIRDVCEAELRAIGDDLCERGHLIPAQFLVNRYIKRKYACPKGHCVKTARPLRRS